MKNLITLENVSEILKTNPTHFTITVPHGVQVEGVFGETFRALHLRYSDSIVEFVVDASELMQNYSFCKWTDGEEQEYMRFEYIDRMTEDNVDFVQFKGKEDSWAQFQVQGLRIMTSWGASYEFFIETHQLTCEIRLDGDCRQTYFEQNYQGIFRALGHGCVVEVIADIEESETYSVVDAIDTVTPYVKELVDVVIKEGVSKTHWQVLWSSRHNCNKCNPEINRLITLIYESMVPVLEPLRDLYVENVLGTIQIVGVPERVGPEIIHVINL